METYLISLVSAMELQRDPVKAAPMSAYMRNQFPYLGIKSPQMAEINRQFYRESGLPPIKQLPVLLAQLWAMPEREYQYFGVGLLCRMVTKLLGDFIDPIEKMLVEKSWWDTVDSIATEAVGRHFRRYPSLCTEVLPRWRSSKNIWLRRTAILHQLDYKKATDFELLTQIISENLGSKEFFINKAIGWALREYSKTDADAVRSFVAKTDLSNLSRKEALKWLERKQARGEN